ncbi:MAG: acetyl-CoA carboxylase biotin carboxyl carrier protein [Planctomycetota bacterium]
MKLEDVESLILLMQKHDLSELQVKEADWEFSARRGGAAQSSATVLATTGVLSAAGSTASAPVVSAATPTSPEKLSKEITSPIVGTFYRSPGPDQPPYKEPGDHVNADDVVCIIEAMKVMNEIKAGLSGTLKKVLVENASAVEFGQPLFLVEVG